MISLIAPLLVLGLLAVLVALGVWVVTRLRSGAAGGLTPRVVLLAYLYVMSLGGLIAGTVGLAGGLKVALTVPFGMDFSYYRPVAVPSDITPPGETPTPKPGPSPEDLRRAAADTERQRRQDVIEAATAMVVGLGLFATHTLGRRRMAPTAPAVAGVLNRVYTAVLLAIFGIIGVISLIAGLQDALKYLLLPVDQYTFRNPPGQSVGMGIVFVPAWLYYLWALVRQSRAEDVAC